MIKEISLPQDKFLFAVFLNSPFLIAHTLGLSSWLNATLAD
jgi:hypothetical protein